MSLKNKRILITAGPTWVAIDKVRVISNIATGQTGILLAEKLSRLGAKVVLLLGPADSPCLRRDIKLIRFKFFDELRAKIIKEIKSGGYGALIHAAAVSDYKPAKIMAGKINSGLNELKIILKPTEKLINKAREAGRSLFIVGFKFEAGLSKGLLIKKAQRLIKSANLNLAVANTFDKSKYRAYILGSGRIYGPMANKKNMVDNLVKILGESL